MSYEQSNVGPGMVPHRKGCRCDECEIDRLKARLAEAERERDSLQSLLDDHDYIRELAASRAAVSAEGGAK